MVQRDDVFTLHNGPGRSPTHTVKVVMLLWASGQFIRGVDDGQVINGKQPLKYDQAKVDALG